MPGEHQDLNGINLKDRLNSIYYRKKLMTTNNQVLFLINLPVSGRHLMMKNHSVSFSKFNKRSFKAYKYNCYYVWLNDPRNINLLPDFIRRTFIDFILKQGKHKLIINDQEYLTTLLGINDSD
jgi:hypothetical protein